MAKLGLVVEAKAYCVEGRFLSVVINIPLIFQ